MSWEEFFHMCDFKQLAQKMLLVLVIYTNFKHLMDIYNLIKISTTPSLLLRFLCLALRIFGSSICIVHTLSPSSWINLTSAATTIITLIIIIRMIPIFTIKLLSIQL